MPTLDRREFLGSALGGLAALSSGSTLFGQDRGPASPKTAGGPDTLFLTWQRDPTTTMTVQWVGPKSEDATAIQYAEAGKNADASAHSVATRQRPYPKTELQVFRAELTGLEPGTEYQFRIDGSGTVHKFRTMPARATDTFSFVSGGDCDVNPHAVANNLLAAKQDPMFALIGGDLGYDDGTKVDKSLGFLRNYSQQMIDTKGRRIPMVVCIGNHEVTGGYGKTLEQAPFFRAVHDGLYDERSYATLDFGDYLSLVLLDTGHAAPIDGEQTEWLDKVLADRADRAHLFAVNHVPAYPSHRKFESDNGKPGTGALNRKHWVPLFERHNVDVVLEHHDHTFKRTHPLRDGRPNVDGVLYLGDGSWGKLRAAKSPASRPYLAAASESYHLSLHRLEGEQRFHLAMEAGGRIVDICSSRKRPRRAVSRRS